MAVLIVFRSMQLCPDVIPCRIQFLLPSSYIRGELRHSKFQRVKKRASIALIFINLYDDCASSACFLRFIASACKTRGNLLGAEYIYIKCTYVHSYTRHIIIIVRIIM